MAGMTIKRGRRRILPFRIPLFRIFYSITYTTLYLLLLVFLAITPAALLYTSFRSSALQYVFMIGGTYILTLLVAVFIYSSRLYTNRSVLAAVGKAYIPVEDGEVNRSVRKMIVGQLERSAVVAWESRPRDVHGEILKMEQDDVPVSPNGNFEKMKYRIGTIISVDPDSPPWGLIQHAGWSSPSHRDDNVTPNVQFDSVIAELPHLIEARAVSLAPPDPILTPIMHQPRQADAVVVGALQRQANMGLRDYLKQIGYLGLVQPPSVGEQFLALYEKARFSGEPTSEANFKPLMTVFAQLLSGMDALDPNIIKEIRRQTEDASSIMVDFNDDSGARDGGARPRSGTPYVDAISRTASHSPVTARQHPSRSVTPFTQIGIGSEESLHSVITHRPEDQLPPFYLIEETASFSSADSSDIPSDAGSVLRYEEEAGPG